MAELQEKHISRPVISAIAMAMKGRHERTQSIAEFVSNLENRANKSKKVCIQERMAMGGSYRSGYCGYMAVGAIQ